MRTISPMVLCFVVSTAIATEVKQVNPATAERDAVLVELSQKSGLPSADLTKILSDCNVNQQSLYFCAWRDQIGANFALERVLGNKHQQFPTCKASMDLKVETWTQARDKSCAKSATKEFGEGSIKPTAQAICVTAETVKITKRLERLNGCSHQ